MSKLLLDPQILWVAILTVYVLLITFSLKFLYAWFVKKGVNKDKAIYYNRKLIHVFAGGVVAFMVPFVFTSPIYPLISGMFITFFTLLSHRSDRILYWFQTEKNLNDVSFCFMWSVTIFLLWLLLGNPWIAVIPPVFMAVGDGVTGIIRNFVFEKRNKHFIGNIWMAAFCIPLGFLLAAQADRTGMNNMIIWALIAALAASIVERYEIGPIDDNVLIATSSSIILLIGSWF